ncbi:NAD(P)H-quinone oxidoreductase subunit U, chloroplastic-like [Vicia villosa]|uniref:NAD(P)H-quinone oxidoreductase subunit U, chloroplastic-like n=1 Tax=Vicia villosa TaxID=3911 RepID=UPI00273AE640|nr:NAD(P)H-quinone oxidoreductase subunit U, chloroplastic-like [Vicia villosa]
MALSPSTSLCILPTNPITPTPKFRFSTNLVFTVNLPRKLSIRSSGEISAGATEVDSEDSIELPKESSSLISILNVERALRGIPITDADHYGRLGLPRGCPYDMVPVAYNNKVQELESQGLEKDILNKKLELLRESYTIMSTPEERRMYDWSLAREGNTEKFIWPYEVDILGIEKGEPPQQEPEDVGPTRLVGYFLVGWIVLAFVLSIGLNL